MEPYFGSISIETERHLVVRAHHSPAHPQVVDLILLLLSLSLPPTHSCAFLLAVAECKAAPETLVPNKHQTIVARLPLIKCVGVENLQGPS